MPLESGSSLGAYEVIGLLGAGGMGEVYRARDTKLGRDVALKILPDSLATDPERLARFQREAQVLASLNHPQIGAIYGLEDANGQRALVLELVEGPTLADRIAQGPVPTEEALPIARQIAEALEASHEQGVIHRDLKPANIKLRPDGVVKVLDFGLAAVAQLSSGPVADATESPTLTLAATRAGVILGTAAYMSPEQASGKPVDKRTDIWSFGVVFWEMLTGRRLFDGETISHTLADVLQSNIDFEKLPTDTPQAIQELLQRCLDRNASTRLRDMGEARIQIEKVLSGASHGTEAHDSAPSAHRRKWWRRAIPVAATAVLAATIAGAAAWHARPAPTLAVTRFPLEIGEGQTFAGVNRSTPIVISPDGSHMAYLATSQQRIRLYLRSMSELDTRPISGADGANLTNPAFSPDGRSLAFWSAEDRTLKRIGISGGTATTICPSDNPSGMSWDESGIVFGQLLKGVMRVSPNGGVPELIASVRGDEQAFGPQMLPGGRALLFTLARGSGPDRWDKAQIVFQVLSSGERKILVEGGSAARYLPTGHLVYALRGVLFAVPFDLRRLEVTGAPVPIVEGVSRGSDTTGVAHFGFSASGTLIYLPGPVSTSADHQLVLLDRNGGVEPLKLPPGSYEHPRVSPDGKRIVFGTDEGKEATVWIYDLSGTTALRRLTFGGRNRFPIWSADGQRIAFQSDREGDRGIFWQPADGSGTPERLTKANQGTSHVPESWSPKGETFSFTVSTGSTYSLSTLSLRDRTTMPFAMVQSSAPINSAFSPDGRWLAYTSAPRVGAPVKVLVEPFPGTGAKYEIAPRALFPVWSPDSRELLFTPQGQLVFVRIDTQRGFTFGNPVSLPVPEGFGAIGVSVVKNYDIMRDGKRFVAATNHGQSGAFTTSQIQVVLNWFEELKQRVPTK